MLRLLVPIVLIYISQGTYAFDNSMDLNTTSTSRDLSSISDLFPELEDFECSAECEGPAQCGQFQDINSCVDGGAELGCFWACR